MGIPLKNFAQFTDDMVAAWAAALGFQPTLQAGDALYALMQSVAAQMIFCQAQAAVVNAIARAQTSNGADLDTFYAQFDFPRIGGNYAGGNATFAAFAPLASQVAIPPNVVIQTQGGAIQYQTIADPTQSAWVPSQNAYVIPAGQTSCTVTIQALLPGLSSNVVANQLTSLATPVPGIATVTNPSPIQNGTDAELDASYRARFVGHINSLSKATLGAIQSAIQAIQAGIEYNLQENVDTGGNPRFGEFVATIDDGSGSPPGSLITQVQAALEATRGFTILAQALAVTKVSPPIVTAIKVGSTYSTTLVKAAVQAAVVAAVNALPIGATLFLDVIVQAALSVAGVTSVQLSGTTVNGVNADYAVNGFDAVRIVLSNVTVGTY